MMKQLVVSFLLLMGVQAIAQTEQVNPEVLTYTFYKNKTIHVNGNQQERTLNAEMDSGNKVVFQFVKKHAENPLITDDEMVETLTFEVDASWRSFIFIKKLPMSKATYKLGCFCVERGYFNVTGGYIRGRKLANGNYYIEADAVYTFNNGVQKNLTFKGEFTPAK
jgi:hypothetical protein